MTDPNPYRSPQDLAQSVAGQRGESTVHNDAASRHVRLVAAFIDGVPLAILYVVLLQVLNAWQELRQRPIGGPTFLGPTPMFSVSMIMWLFASYEIVQAALITVFGQSFGKLIMKIRIARVEDDANPGFVRAVLLRRWLISILGIVPLFTLFDHLRIFKEDLRCIHDLLAGTHVVFVETDDTEMR